MGNVSQFYKDQIITAETEREKYKRKEQYLPVVRLVLFVLVLIIFYNYLISGFLIFLYGVILSLFFFFYFSWLDSRLKLKMESCDRVITICSNEIKGINGDFSPFDPGKEYIDPEHNYTHDLDLFGTNSLFHCINRTVTIFGKNRLAVYFKDAFDFTDRLAGRQESILELSGLGHFRQQMQLVFYCENSTERDRNDLTEWLKSDNKLLKNKILNSFRFILPILTNGVIAFSLMGFVVIQVPIFMFILQLLFVAAYSRKTIQIQLSLTAKVKTISRYAQLLRLIENQSFTSPYLNELKGELSHDGIEPPSKIITQLFRLLNWMDTNLNLLASLVLNGLFLFNIQLLFAVEKWKSKYAGVIPGWFDALGEFDAIASLANFSANNPDYIYPVAVKNQFKFEAVDLGHPLIPQSECVTNNISISGWNQYCIITGANMSGKSTFLRTVGINYILAMLGAPVFAKQFVFCPVILHSSIRTSDSLSKKESFFYAELKRLHAIISNLKSGQKTFILLDEILKGTNSKDKQIGSVALLEQLVKFQSVGLIATHDLILGDLIKDYPENIHNLCFEIQIEDGEMKIDYKLQPGVCRNLNATFLMKKMGILMNNLLF